MAVRWRSLYDRLYRQRRWDLLRKELAAARLRWTWDGGSRERQDTIRYLERLVKMEPPPNPRRPNHWYWRQGGADGRPEA